MYGVTVPPTTREQSMSLSRYSDDPDLDAALAAASPPTPQGNALTAAAAAELVEAARVRSSSPRRAGRRRVVAVTAAVGLGLAGVGAAAAAVTHADWSRWAQDPDVLLTYTLPSGAVCEERIGGTIGADRDAVEAAREFFREHDVLALADVEGEIARMRADDDVTEILPDGSVVDASYGTPYYRSADEEYAFAVSRAVGAVFVAELERQGMPTEGPGSLASHGGEIWCPDARW
jgi:hypothetical protein